MKPIVHLAVNLILELRTQWTLCALGAPADVVHETDAAPTCLICIGTERYWGATLRTITLPL